MHLFSLCAFLEMREKGDSTSPWTNGSMRDKISLGDPIMRDCLKTDERADKIWDHTDAIHSKTTHFVALTHPFSFLLSSISCA